MRGSPPKRSRSATLHTVRLPPVRVLHVDTALDLRGGQRQLAHLLVGRPDDGWAGVPDAPLARLVGPPTVALFSGGDPRNILRLRGAMGWDLVAVHTSHAHGVALFCGRRVVVHRRVDFAPRHPWKYRSAAAVIAVSAGVARVLARAGVGRVHVVHDGVDPPLRVPPLEIAGVRPVWGAAGALVAHKGHRHLVDAMARVPGTLVIVGEGPLRGALEAQVRAQGLLGRVRLVGQIAEVGALFAAIDTFVHPSVEEGFGQVVIEALASGCRVVATRAGGVPEALGDGGILVAPGDPEALAAGMLASLAWPLGGGVEQAKRFSVSRMVEGTSVVYEAVFGGGGAA